MTEQECIRKLEAVYTTLPEVHCKRKCQNYCGPIIVTKMEAARLQAKRGLIRIESSFKAAQRLYLPAPAIMQRECVGLLPDNCDGEPQCVFLGFGKCTAYQIRPLICRIWGAVQTALMKCPHGCIPDRWLTNRDVKALFESVIAIQKEWERANGSETTCTTS